MKHLLPGWRTFAKVILASILIAAAILVAFNQLWLPRGDDAIYPWGSDTMGHIMKAEFLQEQIEKGNIYPQMFPFWYNGQQIFRYHPPVPYYLLVGINQFTSNMVIAGHWFIILTSIFAGLSFLLYSRWVGINLAAVGGILYVISPDNLRVSFSDGNLPRVLAAALLPLLVYNFIRILESNSHRRHILLTVIVTSIVILSHAMMGAIFIVCMGMIAGIYWLLRNNSLKPLLAAIFSLTTGILISSFWLLPSLSGGITGLNQEAVKSAIPVFSISTYLNPFLRFKDPEIYYFGLAITLTLVLGGIGIRKIRNPLLLSFFLPGLLSLLISTPGFNDLFNGLPANQLFWPIRFITFTSFAFVFCLLIILTNFRFHPRGRIIVLLIIAGIVIDSLPSITKLVYRRNAPENLIAAAEVIKQESGWRTATLDLSRLGSPPSYFLTALAGREQLHGWAYQGACTSHPISLLNSALETSNGPLTVQLLNVLAADDLLVLDNDARIRALIPGLIESDFRLIWDQEDLKLYHRDGGPRAWIINSQALGIGSGASNIASIYPSLLLGSSNFIDDYESSMLEKFPLLVLSRFNWRNQKKAEAIVLDYISKGGQVLIDLNGTPDDPLAREPRFLNVYGERVNFYSSPKIIDNHNEISLSPFVEQPWVAVVPQGVPYESIKFEYHGVSGTALGYLSVGKGKAWFVGLNLPYHVYLTHDPVAKDILDHVIRLQSNQPAVYESISLQNYKPYHNGYSFTYKLQRDAYLLIPMSSCDGMNIYVDGHLVENQSLYSLIGIQAPAGEHTVDIRFRLTLIYFIGGLISILALVTGLIALGLYKGNSDEK